jgi:hypothetical protein
MNHARREEIVVFLCPLDRAMMPHPGRCPDPLREYTTV